MMRWLLVEAAQTAARLESAVAPAFIYA